MKCLLLSTIAIIFTTINAQNLSDLSFGTNSSLEVSTWNIEWFPKSGQSTVDSVSIIIQSLDIDIYALQEISDTNMFKQMIENIEGYDYYFKSGWFAGLAYVYKSGTVEIDTVYEIYTEEPYWRPFPRSPMVMEMNYQNQKYFIINNHFKCCGDGNMNLSDSWDEETRRYDASNLLKDYIDVNLSEENVIVLGDLNDILTDPSAHNVFQTILDDDLNFLFADIDIANGPSSGWSYPNWPSHIDHIFITNELYGIFDNSSSLIQTIQIDENMAGGFNEYDNKISDHLPVAIKLDNNLTINDELLEPNIFQLTNYPNPFNSTTTIFYEILNPGFVNISIHDISGYLIEQLVNQNNIPGLYSLEWNANPFSSGIYFYTITMGNQSMTQKMLLLK
ncbi:MAG: T9SS type A sorting domain-containing protein [Candidatus Marinimicrobia bacterium]|jgi:endonuclease/exonuclease/phosphatase family metal-dependent hydrolase|nr:T9SS type A sorting domain-containing protein [Candidatus Neomarinimicrobiota bacterium]MBT3937767.1 T9SS type A sorting domain-containing protein [Candidatus Neomarinimicrobiota bacterium]MBT3962323.1 T9SS type A sorting domain-containing protein [Candidatus Neomarinimicrobiota bacterium]MBT4382576.1 T9SS type A sorting domain-containing protein [Candidatus Neomarinimicrobiota bacterium]MBT4635183.1 T9SS type A sorting domain-containing protein [Candidatus Neomarinimicrobiota bacterium]